MKKEKVLAKSVYVAENNQNNQVHLQCFNKENLKKCQSLLKKLMDDKRSLEFRVPVDYIGLGLHDYPLIIEKPMDLSTVKKNLKDEKYSTLIEFFDDLQLTWDNCKKYNLEESVSRSRL
jgi:hypothetical protein